jgi:hypothetical protein
MHQTSNPRPTPKQNYANDWSIPQFATQSTPLERQQIRLISCQKYSPVYSPINAIKKLQDRNQSPRHQATIAKTIASPTQAGICIPSANTIGKSRICAVNQLMRKMIAARASIAKLGTLEGENLSELPDKGTV